MTAQFSEHERAAMERVARWVVRRGLTVPAILFLESVRPMNRVGAAAMTFFHPLADALFDATTYAALRDAFERREAVETLLRRIEALDARDDSDQEAA